MKTSILVILFVLTQCFITKANQDCIWTSSKSGVTIRFIAPCNFENQNLIDSFVNKVILLLNRRDTSLKVLVLVNNRNLSFPNALFSNFFSIGFDTLREIDNDFIFDNYWNEENGGSIPFDTRNRPIDINSTSNRIFNETGIKIIYDKDFRLGEPDWNDISKTIVYAATNVDLVKKLQARDTVRYNTNGWYVSLVTLDPVEINRILGKEIVKREKKMKTATAVSKSNIIISILGLIALLLFFITRWKHSR